MRLTPQMMFRFVAPKQGKPMVFPYTFAARWSQFDFVYEYRNAWPFRYSLYAAAMVFPLVWYIDSAVNSPGAKAAYAAKKKAHEDKEHEEHMWADIQGRYKNRK